MTLDNKLVAVVWVIALFTIPMTALSEELTCTPETPPISLLSTEPDLMFCSHWNPEFSAKGSSCCPKVYDRKKRGRCIATRKHGTYCDEKTQDQSDYEKRVKEGKITDILENLKFELASPRSQAICTVNTGFLAWGRPIVETSKNRIKLRSPGRCSNFGTDRMAMLMEWLGLEVAKMYPDNPKVKLLVADISAPRGGCLGGRTGGRGHTSHMTGQDADIGFLTPLKFRESPGELHRDFDIQSNWLLIKKIFENPFVCIKVIFLDKRLIKKLSKKVSLDPDWVNLRSYIRHVRGHRDHLHIRIGNSEMLPGCHESSDLDEEEESDGSDSASDAGAKPDETPGDYLGDPKK